MFKRVLVANRGEIAHRVIRTLNKMGIESVVVFSEADRALPYVQKASISVCIGPAQAKESYLNEDALLETALLTDCEAIHPGFGFLSENALFAKRCELQKLTFIGPSPMVITLMGDKAKARETMADLQVPTLVGSKTIIQNLEELKAIAKTLGYPVLLKARAGGGGKGMRLVESEDGLQEAFEQARFEALSAFKDGELYVEKFIKNARHIEFQILGDHYGNIVVIGERECSIQRKNQKLLEEAPANNFSDETRKKIATVLTAALKKLSYQNAGTVEFLMDADNQLYFMEMNTRIQVEHPVTELVYGIDIVEWQIRIACNERLPFTTSDLKINGAALECRINAEDASNDFLPSPGVINRLSLPKNSSEGPVRIDTHITEGSRVVPFYDSMLAKVITHGKTRNEALELMKKVLQEIELEGIKTTLPFHKALLEQEDFVRGHYDCSLITTHLPSLLRRLKKD